MVGDLGVQTTFDDDQQILDRFPDVECVVNDNDAGHGQAGIDLGVREANKCLHVVTRHDTAVFGRPIQKGRIVYATKAHFLNCRQIELGTQSAQRANDV